MAQWEKKHPDGLNVYELEELRAELEEKARKDPRFRGVLESTEYMARTVNRTMLIWRIAIVGTFALLFGGGSYFVATRYLGYGRSREEQNFAQIHRGAGYDERKR